MLRAIKDTTEPTKYKGVSIKTSDLSSYIEQNKGNITFIDDSGKQITEKAWWWLANGVTGEAN